MLCLFRGREVKDMHGWASEVPLLCATGYQKREVKKSVGAFITKWLKIKERELGLITSSQYPVSVA